MDFREKWQGIMVWMKKRSGSHGKMTKGNWIILLCTGLLFLTAAMPSRGAAGSWRKMLGLDGSEEQAEGAWGDGTGLYGGQDGSSGGRAAEGTDREAGTVAALGGERTREGEPDSSQGAYLYSYEASMERRVKEMLAKVEGVGEVDVLIVLKSSEQKVYQTDGKSLYSSTKEQDSSGGMRQIAQQDEERSTVLVEGGDVSLHAGLGGSGLWGGAGSGALAGEDSSRTAAGTEGNGPLLEKELRPEVSGIVISAQGGGEASVKAEITAAMEALFDLPAHKIKVLKRAE